MQVAELLIDPSVLWANWDQIGQPLAFIDLDRCPEDVDIPVLPPVPLIGLGEDYHPLAARLDAIVEPPVSAELLIRQIMANPNAAAIMVQLLRGTEGLPPDRALVHESMCYGLLQGSDEHAQWMAAQTEQDAPEMGPGTVHVDLKGDILHVVLDRPEARNAIDRVMRDALFEAFSLAAIDPEIRAIKLRATGTSFSMGADLGEFGTTRDPATAHLIRSYSLPAVPLARRPEILDVHVQGPCVGSGLEIAAFAGRMTASAKAWFQLPELSMGIIPGAGGCVSVPRRIGRQRAALMILSGKRINALTALSWGLIDAIEDQPPADDGGADQTGG